MSHHRGSRQDVKARTMRFVALDPDIASKYDELDEEESNGNRLLRFKQPRDVHRGGGSSGNFSKKVINIIERHITRKDQNTMRTMGAGTSSSRRDLINLVTVKNVSRSGKDHVLKLLANSVDRFIPISPKMQENGDLIFFIPDDDDAQAICLMSRRIADKHSPNIKFSIFSKRVPAPFESISFTNRQIIERVVKSRFKQQTNSIDLSSFQNDPLFERSQLSYGLFHNHVVIAVANLIAQNFSSIRGIRLNNNSLRNLDYLSCLVYAAPNVVELDLANNAISRVNELDKLKNWALESVHFENNEFVSSYQGFAIYAKAIHQYFPRVTYLDGRSIQASPERGSSDVSSAVIPRFKPGFYTDESYRTMAQNFLLEFFTLYDGPNCEHTRQQLMNAYDANATFTYSFCFLTDTHPTGSKDRSDHQELIGLYIRSSHNIIQQHKWQSYRDKIIYRGPMDIAVALSKLPPTEHIKQSFLLDFNFVANGLMVLLLQGIFRDGKEVLDGSADFVNVKFFTRQFSIVPRTERLAIISDTLQITPVSTARMERYNNLLKNATVVAQNQLPTLMQQSTVLSSAVQQQNDGMAPPRPLLQSLLEMRSSNVPSAVIPRFRPGFYTDESYRTMAQNFLLEFFTLYDGPNCEHTRQQLMNAYDANATFTYSFCFLTDTHPTGSKDRSDHQELIGLYIRSSHNIIQQHKWQSYRDKIIYRGPMDIAVALSKLPPTEHIKQSFLLDFNFVANGLMVLLLQGIFRDGKEVLDGSADFVNVKFFTRQFSIVPRTEGLAIISDTLQITPVSTARMERYNNLLKNATVVAQTELPTLMQQSAVLSSAVQQQIDGMAPPPPSPQTIFS